MSSLSYFGGPGKSSSNPAAAPSSGETSRTAGLERVALGLIMLLGFLLRLYKIEADSVWLDEATTCLISVGSVPEMLEALHHQHASPPLYYFLLHLSLQLGQGEFFLRFPSALFGVLCIPAIYQLGRIFFGETEGLLSALLLAVLPYHVWYSQETRMYSLLSLFAMLSTISFWKALWLRSRKYWLLYLVFTSLSLYTHYFAAFLLLAQGLLVAPVSLCRLWGETKGRASYRPVLEDALTFAAVGLMAALSLCIPWKSAIVGGTRYTGATPGPDLNLGYFQTILKDFSGQDAISMVLFTFFFVVGLICCVSGRRLETASLLVLILVPLIVTAIFLQVVESFFSTRYVIPALGFYLVVVARGTNGFAGKVGDLSRRVGLNRAVASAAVTAFVLAGILFVKSGELRSYYKGVRADWRSVAAYVSANEAAGDVVGVYVDWARPPFDFYYHGNLDVYPISSDALTAAEVEQCKRVWAVFAHTGQYSEIVKQINTYMDQHFAQVSSRKFRGGIEVRLYEK